LVLNFEFEVGGDPIEGAEYKNNPDKNDRQINSGAWLVSFAARHPAPEGARATARGTDSPAHPSADSSQPVPVLCAMVAPGSVSAAGAD